MVVNDSFDSASESLDPHVPEKGKKRKNGVKNFPDPSINQVDEEFSLEETDEQIPTVAESTVDSSRKSLYHFVFLIACS